MNQSQPYRTHPTETPRDRMRHTATVAAEVDKLERHLRTLGPMPKERLAELCHADRWREGTFEEAVAAGVRDGRLTWLAFRWLKATRGARL